MLRWKSRAAAFLICFAIGLATALLFAAIVTHHLSKRRSLETETAQPGCFEGVYFNRPEEVISALKSDDVSTRRDMFKTLFLSPTVKTIYYDYERDMNYPERADRARLEYVQLDEGSEPEAVITFYRFEHPLALIFKKESCGWRLIGALSSWLRFEDYPYDDWLSLPETIKRGVHELLLRESTGDAVSYVRKARLLKLIDGSLREVAEITEETIDPVDEYRNSDWSDVKRRGSCRYNFLQAKMGAPARIEIDVTDEVVKYQGARLAYNYWLETDGAWHTLKRNWNERESTQLKLLNRRRELLVWNEQEQRFANEY